MKASCCSLRRISRTRKRGLRTRPAIMALKKTMPRTSSAAVRQLSRIQLTLSATASPTRQAPSVMKKATDLRWPLNLMRLNRNVTLSRLPEHPFGLSGARGDAQAVLADELDGFRQPQQLERADAPPVEVHLVPRQPVAGPPGGRGGGGWAAAPPREGA